MLEKMFASVGGDALEPAPYAEEKAHVAGTLGSQKFIRTITGLKEPQGVGFVASTDTLYVANAHDGSVQLFQGADLSPAGRIELGDDADNIRVDSASSKVFIGYGGGALAVIDPATRAKIADIPLKAHPEAFVLDEPGKQAFVNLPDARQIAVVDIAAIKVSSSLSLKDARSNFPMALDREEQVFLAVTRSPPKLLVFGLQDHALRKSVDTCGDADDVFVDAKRQRAYVSCGEGFIDIFDTRQDRYEKISQLSTASGARTSLFVPVLDRLFLAVRAAGSDAAAI
jgi:DNA-binding beta-propeller fold protein YncE